MVRRMPKVQSKSIDRKNNAYTPPKIVRSWKLVAHAVGVSPPPGQ